MTIGKFPSWSMYEPGKGVINYYRHPENDMKELEEGEKSNDPMERKLAEQRRKLLSYKKYEKQIRKYLGPRDYCKYCYGKHFYDIDWFDGVIDCRNCGYHIESIELLVDLIEEGKI